MKIENVLLHDDYNDEDRSAIEVKTHPIME